MTTTRQYKSTDPGMPTLSGTAGALLGVLDVLVNGGSTQSVTSITRSGSTATATKTAHGLRDGVRVVVAGADQPEYNVNDVAITVTSADTFTFPVTGTPATPATGTITVKMAGAGWTKPFSGTGKAGYRAPMGNRFYLRVLDDGSDGTNAAKVANIRGYESMTDVDTGTGDFPTIAQMASGLWASKSSTADTTARPWIVLADEKRVIVLTAYLSTLTEAYNHWCFGDLVGTEAGDAYATLIYGSTSSANAVNTGVASLTGRGNLTYQPSATGLYVARQRSGTGTSQNALTAFTSASGSGSGHTALQVPSAGGHLWLDTIQVVDGSAATSAPRGRFPGVLFNRNYLDYATYPTGTAFGQYEVVRYSASHAFSYLIDTGNWE